MDQDKKRWIILIAAAITVSCTSGLNVWSVFNIPLREAIGATPSEAALPYSVCVICLGLFAPVAGKIMDKVGPRIVLVIGTVLVIRLVLFRICDNTTSIDPDLWSFRWHRRCIHLYELCRQFS